MIHLVGAAATPMGGDHVSVRVIVETGAHLVLRTVAASVVLPGRDRPDSTASWHLDLDPQPTIVADTARHTTNTVLRLTDDAHVRIRERVRIGRSGECDGLWEGSVHADVDGGPLVRHRVLLGAHAPGHDVIDAPSTLVSELRRPAAPGRADPYTLHLAGGGTLRTQWGSRLPG